MLNSLFVRYTLVFKPVFDQVDTAAWAVLLVPQYFIGRASGSAKSTVNAIAQNLVGPLNLGILKLLGCKHRLHLSKSLKSHHSG